MPNNLKNFLYNVWRKIIMLDLIKVSNKLKTITFKSNLNIFKLNLNVIVKLLGNNLTGEKNLNIKKFLNDYILWKNIESFEELKKDRNEKIKAIAILFGGVLIRLNL